MGNITISSTVLQQLIAAAAANIDVDAPAVPAKGKGKKAKKAKAQPAQTPDFIVKRAKNKAANLAQAEFLRGIDVTPSGTAWTLANAGERSAKKLQAANAQDGIKRPSEILTNKAEASKVEATPEAPKKATRSEAAKKAAETRKFNRFAAPLREVGLTEAQIQRAYEA